MSKPIWIRLRSVLDRDADATSVELSRESAEEMLAEIIRLTAEVEKLTEQKIAFIGEIDRLRETQRTVLVEQGESVARLTAEVERLRSLTVVQESLIRKSEAANEKLRAALEPFAAEADCWLNYHDDEPLVESFPGYDGKITVGACRRARAEL